VPSHHHQGGRDPEAEDPVEAHEQDQHQRAGDDADRLAHLEVHESEPGAHWPVLHGR
jgi:hypothetical protein